MELVDVDLFSGGRCLYEGRAGQGRSSAGDMTWSLLARWMANNGIV